MTEKTKEVRLAPGDIQINGGTQPRATLNEDVVKEYAEAMKEKAKFPPCVVFYDGSVNWLADGFHRYFAAVMAKKSLLIEQRPGTRRDAILHSVGANGKHGLRRTNEDKRISVKRIFEDKEWQSQTDSWIATTCDVSRAFIVIMRKELYGDNSDTPCNVTPQNNNKPKESPPKTAEKMDHTDRDWKEDTQIDAPPETNGYGAPLPPPSEQTTEVINAHLEDETPVHEVTLKDFNQAQEDALSDEEWLGMLPLHGKLIAEKMQVETFTNAALAWRKVRRNYQALRRDVLSCPNYKAPDMYSVKMRSAISIEHPQTWQFSRGAAGGFLL